MSGGAIAIWHDIASEGLEEFYAWHGEEHMPERVAIPGFLSGRRFVAVDSEVNFFNLYETASPDVVRGADYKQRLDNPTPRTLAAVRHFRNVFRSLCRVAARMKTAGNCHAEGGCLATLRYSVDEQREATQLQHFARELIPDLSAVAGVSSVTLLVADRLASGYVNAEQRARGAPNSVPPITLLVEGWGAVAPFSAAMNELLDAQALVGRNLGGDSTLNFYRHQLSVRPGP